MEGESNGNTQPPETWMHENTSYESKHVDSNDNIGKDAFRPVNNDVSLNIKAAASTSFAPTSHYTSTTQIEENYHKESLADLQINITNWINDELTGKNIACMTNVIAPYKDVPRIYQEFVDIYEVIHMLNSDLLNMFDNYLCFAGDEDEQQMTRLSRMACTRAVNNLKAKHHKNGSITETLLALACEKLFSFYWEENQKIIKHEQNIASKVENIIFEEYQRKTIDYFQNHLSEIQSIHQKLLKYCVDMMNHSLDFSNKMNNVHSSAIASLEAKINNDFFDLQRIYESRQITDVPSRKPAVFYIKPSPSKTTAPPNKLQSSMQEYKAIMDSHWSNLPTELALIHLHENAIAKVTKSLNPDEKEISINSNKFYLAYLSERFEESRARAESLEKCLCISFITEGLHIGVCFSAQGGHLGENWMYDPATSSARTILQFRKNQTSLDLLNDLMSISTKNQHKKDNERAKILKVFKKVMESAEKVAGRINRVIVSIPTWLSLEHRTGFRKLIHETNARTVSFLRESSLAVYSIRDLPQMEDTNEKVLVAITVGITGIFVEAYSRNSYNVVKLLVVGTHEWQLDEVPKESFNCFGRGKKPKNQKVSIPIQDSRVRLRTLNATFDKAVTQLDRNQQQKKMLCLLLADSPEWQQSYKEFLESRTNQINDLGSMETNFALKATIQLAKEPSNIRKVIIDYPLSMDMKTATRLGRKITATLTSSQSTMKVEPGPGTGSLIISAKDAVSERALLLKKCQEIRVKIETGQIRLGVLTKKLVDEVIENAEQVGQDSSATEEAILEQDAKLNDVIKTNQFNISTIHVINH